MIYQLDQTVQLRALDMNSEILSYTHPLFLSSERDMLTFKNACCPYC